MSRPTRLVRRQLTAFAVISLLAIGIACLKYLQVPGMLGWGRMQVSADLPRAGGLRARALVTYRGVQVGRVTDVDLSTTGVVATLAVDRDAVVPGNVRVRVHSATAIGEQYLDLVPGSPVSGRLGAGDVLPPATDPVPVAAGTLLGNVDQLFRTLDRDTLRTTVDELDAALGDAGPDLTALLDGTDALVAAARDSLPATRSLLADLGPVLRTQKSLGPDELAAAADLADLTTQLALSDDDLRALIAQGPAVARQLTAAVRDVHPTLPLLLAEVAAVGQVFTVYDANVRQTLVLYPAVVAALLTVGGFGKDHPARGPQYFALNIDNPKACRTGYTAPRRPASDVSTPARAVDAWCQEPATSQLAVRGARNFPCPNSSARSATAAGCGLTYGSRPTATMTAYDPRTGRYLAPDGTPRRISTRPAGVLAALSPSR